MVSPVPPPPAAAPGEPAAASLAGELEELLKLLRADGMLLRWVTMKSREVVYVKSILEAYPGLVSVHAARRVVGDVRSGDKIARLAIASCPSVIDEVDATLAELALETGLERLTDAEIPWTA